MSKKRQRKSKRPTREEAADFLQALLDAGAQLPYWLELKIKAAQWEARRKAEIKLGWELIEAGYRILAREMHPDNGGSHEAMTRLNRVRDYLRSNV
jgi:hypothetical protein